MTLPDPKRASTPSGASSTPSSRLRSDAAAPGAADYGCLEWLGSAVVLLAADGQVVWFNPAASDLFGVSVRHVTEPCFADWFSNGHVFTTLLSQVGRGELERQGQDLNLERPGHDEVLRVRCLAVRVRQDPVVALLLQFDLNEQRTRADREEQLRETVHASREVLRNMAHEIRNPLGGIRGAAQLLEQEQSTRDVGEYTRVIIREVDRLQQLVDRLLLPHQRVTRRAPLNIHEVCEQVRSIVLAEFPQHLSIARDYDTSLPDLVADRDQLVQVLLNLVRNAAQAMQGQGWIRIRTRVARQVVISRVRHRLALDLHVIDQGPGIPEHLADRIFFPLVSGRDGGTGLGLALAQTFVERHGGIIECESRPGWTDFRVLLPFGTSRPESPGPATGIGLS